MHVLMVTDAYPPMRTSCAVQMHDLAQAFIAEGHQVTIIIPVNAQKKDIQIKHINGVRLVGAKAFGAKDINYVSRALAEFINPFIIWQKLKRNPEFFNTKYDGVIWYSPTIFWGPLIKRLKKQYKIKSYLILRDIFPDWALDIGLLKKGISYKFLKAVEKFQYQQADAIGVQSPNNFDYLKKRNLYIEQKKIEVLWNWIGKPIKLPCSLDLSKTKLAGRKIFVYAGNMGIAQGVDSLIKLLIKFRDNQNVGFILIGRGSEFFRVRSFVEKNSIDNVILTDEIRHEELLSLFQQCHIGIVTLDARINSDNIPGKFLSYIAGGLSIVAICKPNSDLQMLIEQYSLGVYGSVVNQELIDSICALLLRIEYKLACPEATLGSKKIDLFEVDGKVKQIIRILNLSL